jgi:S1-C subfamily serine protease
MSDEQEGTQPIEPPPDPSVFRAPAPPPPAVSRPAGGWRGGALVLVLGGALALGAVGGGVAGALATRSLTPASAIVTVSTPATTGIAVAATAPVIAAPPTVAPAPTATAAPVPASKPAIAAAPAAPSVQGQPTVAQAAATGAIADIYKRVSPAVVSVSSRGGGQGGIGSGFIIDQQGHIITNNHVVQNATSLRVMLADGTELPARVIGAAPGNDVALIKVDPRGDLAVAKLGDSDAVVAGELAIAIGSPSGLEQTVTAGIVSSVGRSFGGGGGGRPLRGLIQTDAAINPGNSGGPLLNGNGEVIGINTLKNPTTEGIGFAVSINTVKRLLPQLKAGGRVSAPYLGISGRAVTPQVAQSLGLPVNEGVLIISTVEGGPAATAGIKGGASGTGDNAGAGGDIVTAIDGKPVKRVEDIGAVLDAKKAGDTVEVSIVRDGKPQQVTLTLGEWPTS